MGKIKKAIKPIVKATEEIAKVNFGGLLKLMGEVMIKNNSKKKPAKK